MTIYTKKLTDPSVDRTAMPEAAVDEDGQPRPGEDDIGMAAQPGHGSHVLAESETSASNCDRTARSMPLSERLPSMTLRAVGDDGASDCRISIGRPVRLAVTSGQNEPNNLGPDITNRSA
jgi:hypothetical protein